MKRLSGEGRWKCGVEELGCNCKWCDLGKVKLEQRFEGIEASEQCV